MILTPEYLQVLCDAQRFAAEHVPENYMRIEAEFCDPPLWEIAARPKVLLEVELPQVTTPRMFFQSK